MRKKGVKSLRTVSPGVCVAVNASASHNTQHCPKQSLKQCHIAIDLTINSSGSLYQIYSPNIEYPIIREVYRSPESSLDLII